MISRLFFYIKVINVKYLPIQPNIRISIIQRDIRHGCNFGVEAEPLRI